MDNTGIFRNVYDDEDLEEEVDMNNVISSYSDPDTSFTKFQKNHPEDQVIGCLKTPVQTRHMTMKNMVCFPQFIIRTLVDLPRDKWAIGTKWVFRNKMDERGIVVKNKARLVAQGHTQEEEEEVYVCQPPSFEDPDFLDKVYKVKLIKTLFVKRHEEDILQVQVYVDDIIFGSTKKELSTEFEKLMHDKFQMSSIGELSFFLGLQVQQKSDVIFISQDKYVAEILKKFDFATVKITSTLMEPNKALIKDKEVEDVDVHLYRSMIGSLMYLTASRFDIIFAVCACARFQVTPKTSHLHAVKIIFRYLKGQPKLGLWYPRDSPFDLEAFSDSDYARASLDRKSTTGAEYVAAVNCCGQVTKISQSSRPTNLVADETVHKEWGDRMERATTTASSLEAEQDSVAFLENPTESEGFEQIVDFLNANPINYALTVNPILYTSCIEQFWTSTKVKTVKEDVRIKALVYGNKIIITEASIRSDLRLDDTEGTAYLPNDTICEELARMGAKTTAWNDFSSTMASAIICLANNQKFNFSKFI
ncbi:putative ribonuclease H-like domain-containing protein [Tanacetum coccineum]